MKHVFWLVENKLAGRTGPNNHPWKPIEFAQAGSSAILSVNNGALCHVDEIEKADLAYACTPLSENAPPRSGDKEICLTNLPEALKFVKKHLTEGKVLIHCRSGKDRTGLFMAYYMLREYKMAPQQAMDYVLEKRSIAFSAEGWIDYCRTVLEECRHK